MSRDPEKQRERYRRYYAANTEKKREQARRWSAANPEKKLESSRRSRAANPAAVRNSFLRSKHGLYPEGWAALWDAQSGRCYLCGDPLPDDRRRVHVDHDHRHCPPRYSCARCRRGLACGICNYVVGLAGDDPARLRRIARNLERAQRRIRALLPDQPALFTVPAEAYVPPSRPRTRGERAPRQPRPRPVGSGPAVVTGRPGGSPAVTNRKDNQHMTSIAEQRYNPSAQGFPDEYDRADSEYQIAEALRPHYRRTAELDRNRVRAFRAVQGDEPFYIPDRLWPPGGGIPPAVDPGRGELVAHYCALRDAEASAAQAAAARTTLTCSCCGSTDPSTRARGGPLDVLEVTALRGPRLCDRCAQLIRRAYRARLDVDADTIALEDTPAGPRGQAADRWLNAALGGQDR